MSQRARRVLRRHSLSLALVVLLLGMIGTTLVMGPAQYRAEFQLPVITDRGDYWRWWAYETVLSLEADVWGALILVVLTARLWERGSAEAHDPPEDRTQLED